MESTDPSVSVIMGVYYRSTDVSLLKRSIQSILSQTYKDFEFLICDDGSSSEAVACIDEFAKNDPRIITVRGLKNTNLSAKLNGCLKFARGKYIARMDDDDFSYPERFNVQIAYLEKHPEVAFLGCNVRQLRLPEFEEAGIKSFPVLPIPNDFKMTQPFIHPTLIFRKQALDFVDGYSERKWQNLCEDYDLLLRLYAKGYQGANLQQVLFDYSIPATAKGSRKMKHRWCETITRINRFQELGKLPQWLPWCVKPVIVGLIPENLLNLLK